MTLVDLLELAAVSLHARQQRTPHLDLPDLHPAQQQLVDEAHRFNVASLGRRSGKSLLGIRLLAETALAGKPGALCFPSYKLLSDSWRTLRQVLGPSTTFKSEQEHRLELAGGGSVEWSLDSGDPARGRKFARIVIDEAAMVPDLLDVWNLALRPTLADLVGDAWFMSTPRGMGGFWTLFNLGQDPLEDEWMSWQMPTSVNPFIDADEIAAARRGLPERAFLQEFEAQFLTDGSGVFRNVHAISRLPMQPPVSGHSYTLGIDWAVGGGDYTVVSIFDASLQQQAAYDRFAQTDVDLQLDRIARIVELYRPTLVVCETNSIGEPIIQYLERGASRRRPVPVMRWTASNASKTAMVDNLAWLIENGEITLLDDPVQVAELVGYDVEQLPSGLRRFSAPAGQHDDLVVALGLAVLYGQPERYAMTRSGYAMGQSMDHARR